MKTRMIAAAVALTVLIAGGSMIAKNALATSGNTVQFARIERHPALHKALRQLENAMKTMRGANDDFGGHRVDAMAATQHAIDQLHAAERFDRH